MFDLHVAPAEPVQVAGFRAWLDAYAMMDGGLVLTSILGAQTAVEAVWAYLVGDHSLELADGTLLRRLREIHRQGAAEETETREVHYRKHAVRLPESEVVHLVLVADIATLDGVMSGWPACLVASDPTGDSARFWAFWNKVCPLPALPAWTDYLWQQGLRRGLVQPLEHIHGCHAWRIDPDPDTWGAIITAGLEDGELSTDAGLSSL